MRHPGKIEVDKVDGDTVRGNVYDEFCLGGNPARYNFVPDRHVWVEHTGSEHDEFMNALHELAEYALMEQGYSYDEAHERARELETALRKGHSMPEEQAVNEHAPEKSAQEAGALEPLLENMAPFADDIAVAAMRIIHRNRGQKNQQQDAALGVDTPMPASPAGSSQPADMSERTQLPDKMAAALSVLGNRPLHFAGKHIY